MKVGDYVVYHTSRTWGDDEDGGGERRREFYAGGNIPACLFCAFQGENLGELERHLLRWVNEGCPENFLIDGKFLRTEDGWLEDLEVSPGQGGDAVRADAMEYAQDFFRFFGPRK